MAKQSKPLATFIVDCPNCKVKVAATEEHLGTVWERRGLTSLLQSRPRLIGKLREVVYGAR